MKQGHHLKTTAVEPTDESGHARHTNRHTQSNGYFLKPNKLGDQEVSYLRLKSVIHQSAQRSQTMSHSLSSLTVLILIVAISLGREPAATGRIQTQKFKE